MRRIWLLWLGCLGGLVLTLGFLASEPREPSVLAPAWAQLQLGPKFAALKGKTGLDPLDPVHPLIDATVVNVQRLGPPTGRDIARIRFAYANGVSREYEIWLSHRMSRLSGWQYTGLDRLFGAYAELPGLPLNHPAAPLHIGRPERITTADTICSTPSADPVERSGATAAPAGEWSPRQDALLVGRSVGYYEEARRELWLVPLDGAAPTRLAPDAWNAQWAPDGRFIAYQILWNRSEPGALVLIERSSSQIWSIPTPASTPIPFTMVDEGVLFILDGALWLMPYQAPTGVLPERLRDLPDAGQPLVNGRAPPAPFVWYGGLLKPVLAPHPTRALIAYACATNVCLADRDGSAVQCILLDPLEPAPILSPPTGPTPAPGRPFPDQTSAELPTPTPQRAGLEPTVPRPPAPAPPAAIQPPPPPQWPAVQAAWSPDGERLAVVRSGPASLDQPRLAILSAAGVVLSTTSLGPSGPIGTPQWTPDGRFLFLSAYPYAGRRILVIDTATVQSWDLTQPIWDSFFSLSPDGKRILVTNGRGGFWIAPVSDR